jgi:hypothetical protein
MTPDPSPSGETCCHGITLARVTERCAECGTVVAQGPAPLIPVDVTALPEWAAFVKRHQHHVRLGLGQRGECADCSLIEAAAAADRGDRA